VFPYPIVEVFEQQVVVELSFYCVLWYHPVCVVFFFSFNVQSSSPANVHSDFILHVFLKKKTFPYQWKKSSGFVSLAAKFVQYLRGCTCCVPKACDTSKNSVRCCELPVENHKSVPSSIYKIKPPKSKHFLRTWDRL